MPLILLEGVDGAGKSTLADTIADIQKSMNKKVTVLHRGPMKGSVLEEYIDPLLDYDPASGETLILDRWHVGEMIYGPLYRGKTALSPGWAMYIENLLAARGAAKVVMTTNLDTLAKRLVAKKEDFLQPEHLAHVNSMYAKWVKKNEGWLYEFHHADLDNIHRTAQRILDRAELLGMKSEFWPRSYVGQNESHILFITPEDPIHPTAPGGYPSPGSLSEALLNAFTHVKINQQWTFGFLRDGELDEEQIHHLARTLDTHKVIELKEWGY